MGRCKDPWLGEVTLGFVKSGLGDVGLSASDSVLGCWACRLGFDGRKPGENAPSLAGLSA